MIKPNKLKRGDKVVTISLSSGMCGDPLFRYRYEIGKKRLEEVFGLEVIELKHSLKGSDFIYKHPEARAEDLMEAFMMKDVKAIFSNIGGEDTIRTLPYIDFNIISKNPKIFMGYSDTTVNHFMCNKAGLVSFYGPSIIGEFAENVSMHDYTKKWVEKALFSTEPIGVIESSPEWAYEHLQWKDPSTSTIKRKMKQNNGYEVLQGSGIIEGELIGGCVEVLEFIKGTQLWPNLEDWKNKILFLETSEDKPTPDFLRWWLRNYVTQGIIDNVNGIIVGKSYDEVYFDEYRKEILQVIKEEANRPDLPILFNLNFGHTAPMCILPYGVKAKIDCDNNKFEITESGVV